MKQLFLSLLLIPSLSFAQSNLNDDLKTFNIAVSCVNSIQLEELSEKFEELPVFRALSLRSENGPIVSRSLVLFFNPKEKSYTLYEKFGDNMYCVISLGTGLEMLNPNDYASKSKS